MVGENITTPCLNLIMKDNGRMEREVDSAIFKLSVKLVTKALLLIITKMDQEQNSYQTEIPTKDNTIKVGSMEKVFMFGQMKTITMANSMKAVSTEEDFGNLQWDNIMKDITKTIKKVEAASIFGTMAAFMKENFKMMQSKDLII